VISARDSILARIREALGQGIDVAVDPEVLRQRIRQHPRHIEPAFSAPPVQRFRDKIEAAEATVVAVESISTVALEIERYLGQAGIEKRLVCTGDELLRQIDWPATLEVQQRLPTANDRVGVTSALCGIAETGTLMLISGEDCPTSLNFLPDYHIVVLRADQILLRMEDAWDGLREKHAAMPRSVNFISGPSKTADIEQTVEYGAHGPRCLHVILVS
jgi:L-lactate dehydrogenase complex protein LldG